MNILFTCAGRRTYLLKYFKEQLGDQGKIIAADMQRSAPAFSAADYRVIVPAVYDESYVDTLLDVCKNYHVNVLISLNDLELPILAAEKLRFEQQGVAVIVSSSDVIDICFDKLRTCHFMTSLGLNAPQTYSNLEDAMQAIAEGRLKFPLVIKPRWGSASIGIEFVNDIDDLRIVYDLIKRKIKRSILNQVSQGDFILIQEKITGKEYGLDVMNDLNGNCVGVAVKLKLAMRAGETDKATTVDDPELRRIGEIIGSSLGHIGNLDCDILEMDGKYYILELNPRFGGGFPFSYEAGVNLPKAIINWVQGKDFDVKELVPVPNKTYSKCDYLVDISPDVSTPVDQSVINQEIPVKKIAVYGAGGFGREVAGAIYRINKDSVAQWQLVGFYDDNKPFGMQVSHYGTVLGGMDDLNAMQEPLAVAIAVGDPKVRKQIFDRITNPNISFPNLIAPSFKVLDESTFKMGRGNIVQDGCSFTCDAVVGDFNVFNGSNVMGHDVRIGDFNVIMPGVRLSGGVIVGNGNLFGVGSIVLQQIPIGDNVVLGAGSVLMRKPKDGFTYIGVPAKKFDF